MYPLGMTRSLAVAAGVLALAVPSAASAASLDVSPDKRCYSSGERINLLGSGFSPLGTANITRDGQPLPGPRSDLPTDANGAFNGVLTLFQANGRQTKTYAATDASDSTLTASRQITVAAPRVGLRPANGAPGRLMRITARGFATGPTLWAHVRYRGSTRNLKIGRLKGACGGLQTRRRLLPRNARLGVHRIQFDTSRRYDPDAATRDLYEITVTGVR
jgi:hypothetical protein